MAMAAEVLEALVVLLDIMVRVHSILMLKDLIAVHHASEVVPAVAGVADEHFCVTKTVEKGRTFARLERVEGESSERELSRMLGGEGKAARAMARELMERGRVAKV